MPRLRVGRRRRVGCAPGVRARAPARPAARRLRARRPPPGRARRPPPGRARRPRPGRARRRRRDALVAIDPVEQEDHDDQEDPDRTRQVALVEEHDLRPDPPLLAAVREPGRQERAEVRDLVDDPVDRAQPRQVRDERQRPVEEEQRGADPPDRGVPEQPLAERGHEHEHRQHRADAQDVVGRRRVEAEVGQVADLEVEQEVVADRLAGVVRVLGREVVAEREVLGDRGRRSEVAPQPRRDAQLTVRIRKGGGHHPGHEQPDRDERDDVPGTGSGVAGGRHPARRGTQR